MEQLLDELDCMKIFRVLPLWTQKQRLAIRGVGEDGGNMVF